MWTAVLNEVGVRPSLVDAGARLVLESAGRVSSWHVRRFRRSPRPSEVNAHSADIFWVPSASKGLRRRLGDLDISWVADTGEVHILAPWGLVSSEPGRGEVAPNERESATRRLSPGALATLQHLLEMPGPAIQRDIAQAVGLTQPRIAQVLRELTDGQLVARGPQGWHVTTAERGFDVWVGAHHRLDSLATTWYNLAPPREQIDAILHQAEAQGAQIRLCGDWAADLLAAWRRPGLIVVHSDRSLELDNIGFIAAPQNAATAVVHIGILRPGWAPDDRVLAAMTAGAPHPPLAPVTEIAREIIASGGSDADQAVTELRANWLRARARVLGGAE